MTLLRLILMLAICCLFLHQSMEMPARFDVYAGRMIETPELDNNHDDKHHTRSPTRGGRNWRQGYRETPRKKRQVVSETDTYNLSQFCRETRSDWPPCILFNFPSKFQQSTIDETISDGNVEKRFQYEINDGTLGDQMNHLRIREPKIREDWMGDEFNVQLSRPVTRQKRDTSIAETMIADQSAWLPADLFWYDPWLQDAEYGLLTTRSNSKRDKRSDNDSTEPSLEKRSVPFSSWGGKRGTSFSSWGGKRGPSFSSWGGKRGPSFSSWGGKRGPAFSSWGGKREPAFSSWGGKRVGTFSSWGGKRSPAFSSWGGKRGPAFSSWGGKRDNSLTDEEEKRGVKFASWGGRVNPPFTVWEGKEVTLNDSSDKVVDGKDGVYSGNMITDIDSGSSLTVTSMMDINMEEREGGDEGLGSVGKRTKFSSWGGKRTSETVEPLGDPELLTMEKKDVSFSPWGGKRSQDVVTESRPVFSSWEGKRGRFRTKQANSPPLRQNRRGADFYPWGGKRSDFLLPEEIMGA